MCVSLFSGRSLAGFFGDAEEYLGELGVDGVPRKGALDLGGHIGRRGGRELQLQLVLQP